MATLTSTGLGSGLDINGLVTKLMAAESQPLTDLSNKEAQDQAKLTAFNQVNSSLQAFQSAMSGLNAAASFQAVAAISSDTTVYSATADSSAVPGTYSIEVTQLAQAQKLTSGTFSTINDAVGTGTLTFQFGTDNGAGVFTANNTKAAQSVVIDTAHGSLSGVRDAINAANIGVSATIINDGTGYRLSLASANSGAANSLKITVSGDADSNNGDNNGLSKLAYDPAGTLGNGKNITQSVAAKDAQFNIDGINTISSPSNTVKDVIQGVTLNLFKKSASGVPADLNITRDTTSVQSSVQQFINAYNDLSKTIGDLTAYDAKAKQGAILQGDSTINLLRSQVRRILTGNIEGLSGSYKLLSDIGVSFQRDGTLALDATKLQTAMKTNFVDIAGLFATMGKTSDSLITYDSATDKTKPGSYAVTVTQLATQGYQDGVGTAALANTAGTFTTPFVIDANNNTLALSVDGVRTGAITLAQGSYSTAAALMAEIQSKINGDSALTATKSGVTTSFDNATGKLRLTSNRYGSASAVEIASVGTSTTATLGLSVAPSTTTGVDVIGTINGIAATGSGQYLTGAPGNDAAGLKLQITGGALGVRGSVNYSQGYAYRAANFVGQVLGANGPITSRTDGINKDIADIGKRRDTLNTRLADMQKRYLAQFNAMDALIGQMRSTSDYLTQALAALPQVTSK